MISIIALCAALAVAIEPSVQAIVPDRASHRAITSVLEVGAYELADLDLPPEPVVPFTVRVELGGQLVHLDLVPTSIRDDNFSVQVPDGAGGLVLMAPPPPRTVRGFVRETGDVVGGGLVRDGLRVIVLTPDGVWSIEPLNTVLPSPRARHVIVHSRDEFGGFGTCPGGVPWADNAPPIEPRGGGLPRGLVRVVELRAEADYELFVRNASRVEDTIADVETVMQAVNIVYERDVEVTHNLMSVLVRTTAQDDPYFNLFEPSDLLSAFREWWNTNQGGQARDLAHLFTGKQMNTNTIGIAYIGVVCSSPGFSYGLSETRYNSLLSRRTGLTAHEIGHNFSASHCDSQGECHIMCATINGCDGLGAPQFGASAIGQITSHAASASCLEEGEGQPLQIPLVETFPNQSFDTRTWAVIDGAVVTNTVVGEPSPPFAALLTQTSTLWTDLIDLVGPFEQPITLRFWARSENVSSGENLQVLFTPEGGVTTVLGTITPAPSGNLTVGPVRLVLPTGAIGANMSLGLRTLGNSASDQWFVDDIRLEEANAPTLGFFEPFAGSIIDEWMWPATSGAAINADSPDPVSPPFVLNLDRNDWAETRPTPADGLFPNQDVWISLFLQSNNVEPSKSFRVQYRNAAGNFVTAWQHHPRYSGRSAMKSIRFPLPRDAESDFLAVRLEAIGTDADDDWFVDDVRIAPGPSAGLPIVDDFEDADELIDPSLWFPIEGAVINQGASGEPSGVRSLNLDWQDRLTLRAVDLSGVSAGQQLVLRLWLQHNGVEPGKSFFIDYRRSNGAWVTAWSYDSSTIERTTVGFIDLPIPTDGLHTGSQIRLRVQGDDGSDDWFVDDLLFELTDGLRLPVQDHFETSFLSPLVWNETDNIAVNAGAQNEPSPPLVMNPDRDERVSTQVIDASSPGLGVVVKFWLQHNGVEPGKRLFVDYRASSGIWQNAAVFTSTDVGRVTYGFVHVPLGEDAAHALLEVRLRVEGTDGSDDWFIDNFETIAFTGLEAPVFDAFQTTRLDPVLWVPVVSVPVINQGALGEPSEPFVLNIDHGEVLETGLIDGQTMDVRPTLSFWMQHNGVEAGETLAIEWRRNATDWNNLVTLVSESSARSSGQYVVLDLPAEAAGNALRLRFSVSGDEPNDDWFLDDVFIGTKEALFVPVSDDFESAATLGLRNWSSASAVPTQIADGEPSGDFSLRFLSGDQAVSLPVRLGDVTTPQFVRFWTQHIGVILQDELTLTVTNASGAMQTLLSIPASAVSGAPFTMFEVELPSFAQHDAAVFTLRAHTNGVGLFFVDDFQIDGDEQALACPPDFSGDGTLDFFDVQLFLNAFADRDPSADLNSDSLFDFFDVQMYLGAFAYGCP